MGLAPFSVTVREQILKIKKSANRIFKNLLILQVPVSSRGGGGGSFTAILNSLNLAILSEQI